MLNTDLHSLDLKMLNTCVRQLKMDADEMMKAFSFTGKLNVIFGIKYFQNMI